MRVSIALCLVTALAVSRPSIASPSQATTQEIFSTQVRSVPPMVPPAIPPTGIPPKPQGQTLDYYAAPQREHEWLQEFALTDSSVPPTDKVVPLLANFNSSTASVSTSFLGLNYLASLGSPPDTTVAKSGSRILEATNSSLRLFNTSGGVLATTSTASMFGVNGGMTDPKVYYDNNSAYPRLLIFVEDSTNFTTKSSNLFFGVSRTPDPSDFTSANWCTYWMGGPQTLNGGVLTFYDSPIFGVGADTLTYTTNQYSFSDGSFQGTIVSAGGKVQIENNAVACPWIGFNVFFPTPSNDTTFALMPAQHYTSPSSFTGTTNPVYMISTHGLRQTETSSNIYRVWRIRNVVSGAASLEELDVPVSTYSTPPSAPQASGGFVVDEGDVRVRQIAGIGNSLWMTHAMTCNVSGSNQGCIRVMRFDVGQDAGGHVTASVGQSILFSGPAGVHYWMPAIAATSAQSTIVTFLNSSPTSYLSSAFTTKSAAATSYPAATTLLAGGCSNGIRDGDYQGAQTNPNDLASFWIAGEATPAAGQCAGAWLTRIANVTP